MPYTNDVTPVSEYSYKDFTQTTFDPALTEGYVAGVVAGALVGLSDKIVTLDSGNVYTIRFANKLIELGQVEPDEIVWTPITLADYDELQGIPDITSTGNYLIFTWSENDTVHIFGWNETNPIDSVDVSFAGISSSFATTLQFGICCVYMGLDGCIHIMERGSRTWNVDHTMSADLADDTVRVARAFVSTSTEFVTERLSLLMLRTVDDLPDYFYMVSNIEPWVDPDGPPPDPSLSALPFGESLDISISIKGMMKTNGF